MLTHSHLETAWLTYYLDFWPKKWSSTNLQSINWHSGCMNEVIGFGRCGTLYQEIEVYRFIAAQKISHVQKSMIILSLTPASNRFHFITMQISRDNKHMCVEYAQSVWCTQSWINIIRKFSASHLCLFYFVGNHMQFYHWWKTIC